MPNFQHIVNSLAQLFLAEHWHLSTVESCTGGMVAARITDLEGSSGWFKGGLVVYSNQAKQQWLGVPDQLLMECGAVSEEVVAFMAQASCACNQTEWAMAVSGIAGPGGGSPNKPVGQVCFAWANSARVLTETHHFEGDRQTVRQLATEWALKRLLEMAQNPCTKTQ